MRFTFYSDSKEILRGIYNVIPVTMTKGLEFEKVIVVQRGMDKNQFYVACTRAISELYVVSDNYQDMYDSDDYKETRDEKVENVIVIENKDEQEMSDSSEGTLEVLENTADIQQYKCRQIYSGLPAMWEPAVSGMEKAHNRADLSYRRIRRYLV